MYFVGRKEFAKAWEVLTSENPFPLVCGRVCYRFCEAKCNRKELDEHVSINAVERFLGEYGVNNNLRASIKENGSLEGLKVAVIGGGPAGLSAAHFLAKEQAEVTIFDNNKELGGMLRYAIPQYRLPKELLEKEIQNMIFSLGIKVELGRKVDAHKFAELKDKFDFIIVALGAHRSKKVAEGIEDGPGIMPGLKFLHLVNSGFMRKLSSDVKNVCVVGGGNTAIDVSRTALRMGAQSVKIVYRRTENEMPAHKDEIAAAKKEGVEFSFLTQPVSTRRCRESLRIHCTKMRLSDPDESGRRRPVEIPESGFEIKCDLLLYATGEETDHSPIEGIKNYFKTENDMVDDSIICAGDGLYGPKSVSEAIASGKKVAGLICSLMTEKAPYTDQRKVVYPEDIKLIYVNLRRKDPKIYFERELSKEQFNAFVETTVTISEDMASSEAKGCINCGTCIGCDRCLNFCPDFSIVKTTERGYEIDKEFCKGCGLCSEVCERGVIDTKKEEGDGSN
jgi:NADPH-dependent glutamate synthase beta subunit-like oxidoreductase/Pyruvate/2-oxoacid:ferredoxin oxidoreductase delta subunit